MKKTKTEFYRERGFQYSLNDPEAQIRYKRALTWIKPKPGMAVREIGCKFAIVRELLARRFDLHDYIGSDIDERTLKRIPGYSSGKYVQHDANKGFPFSDSSADYIICLEILEHLENATFFFDEVTRVLKTDGKLILSVPNPYCWTELSANLRKAPDTEGHIASYTQQNIDALIRFAGLKLYDRMGTFTRIPFTRRLFGSPRLVETNLFFLSRSNLFLIGR